MNQTIGAKNSIFSERNLFLIAGIIIFLTAIFSEGYHHFDEHFQVLEFANHKMGLTPYEDLPWEFKEQIRPGFQPSIAYLFQKTLSFIGIHNPFLTALLLRILAGALTFIGVLLFYKAFKDKLNSKHQIWFLLTTFFTWFLLYNSVRFSSEGLSSSLFLIGFSLFFLWKDRSIPYFILIGLMLGLSFLARYQLGFSILGFGIWALIFSKYSLKKLIMIALGLSFAFGFGVLIDSWLYGEYTLTTWNYFNHNIILDKAASFGTSPWHAYFTSFLGSAVPTVSVILFIGYFSYLYFYRNDPISWSTIFFLIIHIFIGHKELRFLFPMAVFLPFMTLRILTEVNTRSQGKLLSNKLFKIVIILTLFINTVLSLVVTFRASDNAISLYREVWNRYDEPVVVYYKEYDPYMRVCPVNYYKKPNVSSRKLNKVEEVQLNSDTTVILVLHARDLKNVDLGDSEEIYSTFPKWLYNFNFNDWLSRTNAFHVFEIHEPLSTIK